MGDTTVEDLNNLKPDTNAFSTGPEAVWHQQDCAPHTSSNGVPMQHQESQAKLCS